MYKAATNLYKGMSPPGIHGAKLKGQPKNAGCDRPGVDPAPKYQDGITDSQLSF